MSRTWDCMTGQPAVFGVPVLHVQDYGLPKTWERSISLLLSRGIQSPTQYDRQGDPLSREATMVMEVDGPLAEPMIHRYFPGGPADLEEYCMEVCEGIKDHWLRDPNDPEDKRWGYTYHGRLTKEFGVNQLELLRQKLIADPFTRQAQAIIWNPRTDPQDAHSPCLQRIWVRLTRRPGAPEHHYDATAHVFFRSRDALKAAFMNAFALIRLVWDGILLHVQVGLRAKGIPATISFEKYVDTSDSYHIYGKDLKDIDGFWNKYGQRFSYCEPDGPPWRDMMIDERNGILRKVADQDDNRAQGA